jgi:23S rRNA pseudouridine2605 synthase
VQLGIHEGRKREVKRMCAAVGHPVRRLCRIEIAGVRAEGLDPGEWRFLKAEEISGLLRMAGLHGA